MNQLLSDNLWPTIKRLSKNASKRAAIAYVSNDRFLRFDDGDQLVCDASEGAIKAGQTDAKVLMRALLRGAKLYSLPGLHAKVLLLDHKAVIGSANVSSASSDRLVEAALVADESATVSQAQSFVDQAISEANPLTKAKIEALMKIDVVRNGAFTANREGKPKPIVVENSRVWIIGTDYTEYEDDDEAKQVTDLKKKLSKTLSKPQSAIWDIQCTGNSRFRRLFRSGDWVIQMSRTANGKRIEEVYPPMLIVGREDFSRRTVLFYLWPKSADNQRLSWRAFKTLAKDVGINKNITPVSEIEISILIADKLRVLWKDL